METISKTLKGKVGVGIAALLIGTGLGATAQPPAEVITETKEVEKIVTVDKPVEVEKRVEVFKSPESCINLIEIDNDLFVNIGEYLSEGNIEGMLAYMDAKTPQRLEEANKCIEQAQ